MKQTEQEEVELRVSYKHKLQNTLCVISVQTNKVKIGKRQSEVSNLAQSLIFHILPCVFQQC